MCVGGTGGRIRGVWTVQPGAPRAWGRSRRPGSLSPPSPAAAAGEDGLAFPFVLCLLGRPNDVNKRSFGYLQVYFRSVCQDGTARGALTTPGLFVSLQLRIWVVYHRMMETYLLCSIAVFSTFIMCVD